MVAEFVQVPESDIPVLAPVASSQGAADAALLFSGVRRVAAGIHFALEHAEHGLHQVVIGIPFGEGRPVHLQAAHLASAVPALLGMNRIAVEHDQNVLVRIPAANLTQKGDERVYLADTSEVEVRELLARQHANVVAGKELVVSMTSPFWKLDW